MKKQKLALVKTSSEAESFIEKGWIIKQISASEHISVLDNTCRKQLVPACWLLLEKEE